MGLDLVEVIEQPLDDQGPLLDAGLQLAPKGQRAPYDDTFTLAITGWAVARGREPVTVVALDGSSEVRRTPATIPSPEVAARKQGVISADACGYQIVLSTVSLQREFELALVAEIHGGLTVPLGTIRGRREPLMTAYEPQLQPLLITTVGRSGSNWLLALLSSHPKIVAYRPFQTEARAAGYWMGVLRTLAEPRSYMQMIFVEASEERWWTGDHRATVPLRVAEPELPRWLGSGNVESVASMCQARIDAFYRHVARIERRSERTHFAEKAFPGYTGRMIRELYPQGREIVLVRDPRDVVCSVLAYNAKQGRSMWLRGPSDEREWLGNLAGQVTKLIESAREGAQLVRYEDLISEPDGTLTALLDSLGFDASAATVSQVLEDATTVMPHAQAQHQTSGSIERSIGRWRQDLTGERRDACAEAFDGLLEQLGYEPTPVQ
jgi:hypothetical protein